MEAILTAIVSEMASRSISFVIRKYSEMMEPTTEDERLHELRRLLQRVSIIDKEAEGWLITNRAMVHQLNILRKEMYRGYFIMDKMKTKGNEAKDHDVSHSFSLSKFNPAKRLFFSADDDTQRNNELQQVIQNLKNIIVDASELIIFLKNYRPLSRQPYSMHLFIGKCMFGRQMEMDRIMDFLMQKEHPGMETVGALPIVGPGYVGKSTLVAHACNDARVRKRFSQIVVVNGDDINDKKLTTLKDGGLIIHQNSAVGKNERLLAIIEFSENVDEVAWNNFYSSFVGSLVSGSKIIVTSNSDKIIQFGTTQALRLNFLPLEAYWYFFKILTFGSVDSSDHPELESIAMEMTREMSGSFVAANIISGILRNNLSAPYWSLYHATFKANIQKNVSLFGEHPYDLMQKLKPACYRINKDKYVVCSQYRACLAGDDVPAITMYDLVSGNAKCEGAFEVLAWKSHILPYKSYIIGCKIQKDSEDTIY